MTTRRRRSRRQRVSHGQDRHGPTPTDVTRAPFEPRLASELYEHILSVIRAAPRGMSRAPRTHAGWGEENRRQTDSTQAGRQHRRVGRRASTLAVGAPPHLLHARIAVLRDQAARRSLPGRRALAVQARRAQRLGWAPACGTPVEHLADVLAHTNESQQASRALADAYWILDLASSLLQARPLLLSLTSSRLARRRATAALPLKRLSPKRLLITRYAPTSKRTKVALSSPRRRDPSSTPPLKTPACGFQRAIPGACIAGVQLRFKWESSLSGNSRGRHEVIGAGTAADT